MTLNEFLGATSLEISAKTGITQANLSLYFRGKKTPTVNTIRSAAEKLQMPPSLCFEAFEMRRNATMAKAVNKN